MLTQTALLGLFMGVLLALTGAGGGILAVPLLVIGAHLGIAEAVPIGLLAVALAAALGAGLGLRGGIVRYRAALLIAIAGMLVSPLGSWLSRVVAMRWLGLLFALTLLYVAYRALRQSGSRHDRQQRLSQSSPPCVRASENGRFIWTACCARSLALSGAIAGLLSGMLGVGGGFVMVPALQRYTDLDMQSIIPTSLAVIALVSAAGVVAHAVTGNVDWTIAMPFAAGALAGMAGGRLLADRAAMFGMQKIFGLTSIIVAFAMIVKSLA